MEGQWLRNAFPWRQSIGPWEERPGHFVDDILNGIEFPRGSSNSTWGSVRAAMGHPDPFNLK